MGWRKKFFSFIYNGLRIAFEPNLPYSKFGTILPFYFFNWPCHVINNGHNRILLLLRKARQSYFLFPHSHMPSCKIHAFPKFILFWVSTVSRFWTCIFLNIQIPVIQVVAFLIFQKKLKLLRARLVCNLSSLNFYYSIFINHHLKYLNFSNPLFGILTQTQFSTSKVAAGFHQKKKKKIKEFVKHCGLVCGFNYESAIEN